MQFRAAWTESASRFLRMPGVAMCLQLLKPADLANLAVWLQSIVHPFCAWLTPSLQTYPEGEEESNGNVPLAS